MRLIIIKILTFLNLEFDIKQCGFGRKLYGGKYYLIRTWLPMADFWSEKEIKSCGGRVVKIEEYGKEI